MNLSTAVENVMSKDLLILNENTPAEEIVGLFKSRGIHHVLIEDNDHNFVGIVSTEDVLEYKYYMFEHQVLLKNIMTKEPFTVLPSANINEVIDVFLKEDFRAIPILDKSNVLIGIVTPYDILNYCKGVIGSRVNCLKTCETVCSTMNREKKKRAK